MQNLLKMCKIPFNLPHIRWPIFIPVATGHTQAGLDQLLFLIRLSVSINLPTILRPNTWAHHASCTACDLSLAEAPKQKQQADEGCHVGP